jgi:Ni,Fe-hydrogenase I large subunit
MSGTRVTIDPITRIEGHLKIEVEVNNGVVTDAWSSGTLFRGIETVLKGRSPEDAWLFTQRLCGVCTYVHGEASVRCVERAMKLRFPRTPGLFETSSWEDSIFMTIWCISTIFMPLTGLTS